MAGSNTYLTNNWLRYSILFVALFPLAVTPFYYVIHETSHALGSEAGYQYWAANHFQWGTEIIQNIGPLGFIHFPLSFAGFLEYEKTLINFALAAVLVSLVIFISDCILNKALRMIFLISFAFMNNLISQQITATAEVNHYLMSLLIVYALFLTRKDFVVLLLMAVLALMSLGKGMFLFISPMIVLLASLNCLLQKRMFMAVTMPLIYILSILIFWVLSGQYLSNLLPFLRGSVAFSSGYNDAMANYDSPLIFSYINLLFFVIPLAAIVAKNLRNLIKGRTQTDLLSATLLAIAETAILFVTYKHGIVASDAYHVFVIILFTLVAFIPFLSIRPAHNGQIFLALKCNPFDMGMAAFLLIAAMCFSSEFSKGLGFVLNLEDEFEVSNAILKTSIAEMQMPKSQNAVKNENVGYFGELPAPMMYNNFHYKASPATISFAAWNHYTMGLDAEFYRNDTLAPTYLVYQLYNSYNQGIAEQFSPQDDSLAQLEIFRRYDPVLDNNIAISEIGRLLLKRRSAPTSLQYEEMGGAQSYQINQWIQVPDNLTDPVQAIIHMPQSLGSKIISMLYRSPGYYIEYKTDDGNIEIRKFVSTTAEDGFLVAPLLTRNDDLLAALSVSEWQKYIQNTNSSLPRMTTFRVICDRFSLHCAANMNVEFRKVHGLEFGRIQSELHYQISPWIAQHTSYQPPISQKESCK